ncbi:MAG: hydrogenase maturation nickel metallochaperone HypA [Gammaproteobacteria bacterium]|nr:hydrogenase maturation nickel metallochaperone HypA [Gammaproteobacteria bacterium]
MHELGVVFHIVDQVEAVAKENNVKHISKLTLEIGEVSTIVPSYFKDCFKWTTDKSEYMKGCELELVILKAYSYCNACEKTYETVKYGKKCPHCGSNDTYLFTGSEVNIKSVETDDKEEA